MLVRNSDLSGIMSSMRQIEDRFNRKFQYPYVFLNDEAFTQNFKEYAFYMRNSSSCL
jgi:alpha 1,2-mannosyltransferase